MSDSNLLGADERLKKVSGGAVRGSRNNADSDRTNKDGSALSAAERRAALRRTDMAEVLPTPPEIPGWHLCWLSTTNVTDPIHKRMQKGYVPVKASEIPDFMGHYTQAEGEFEGCIACNEMLLFKCTEEVYQDWMTILHHDMPNEQEGAIFNNAAAGFDEDRNGRSLGIMEGDFNRMGRSVPTPTFA